MYIAGRVKHMELNQNTEKLDNYRKRAAELVGKMTLEEKVAQTLYQAPAVERLNIKAYNWWNEALHGVARAGTATVFPQAIGLAATFDEDLLEQVGDLAILPIVNVHLQHGAGAHHPGTGRPDCNGSTLGIGAHQAAGAQQGAAEVPGHHHHCIHQAAFLQHIQHWDPGSALGLAIV